MNEPHLPRSRRDGSQSQRDGSTLGAARRSAVPTIADVAARAGVSLGTVSKAMNGRGQLRASTRERVMKAATDIGFHPNALAQGLLTGRTYTVGILTTDIFGRFTIPVMFGIEDGLGSDKISTFLCDGRGDPLREQHYLSRLLARRVDGIVVTGRRPDLRPSIGDVPVPVVYVLGQSQDSQDLSVTYDDQQGAALAVNHLLRIGKTMIAHVTGPRRHSSARLREAGARSMLQQAGSEFAAGEALWGEWSEAWGRDAAHILVNSSQPFDSVFCGSDQIARGVVEGLRENGRRVPEDVAIVGFDNWDVMAVACRPPLTTVDPNLTELGRVAARKLLDEIETGHHEAGLVSLPCHLVIRQSTTGAPLTVVPTTSASKFSE